MWLKRRIVATEEDNSGILLWFSILFLQFLFILLLDLFLYHQGINTYPILQEDRLSVDEALNHPYFQEPT